MPALCNAVLILSIVSVVQFFMVMVFRAVQYSNISLISVTLDVSQLDKSSEDKRLHSLNNSLISVTLDVFQLDKSREVKALQKANILFIYTNLEVSHLETSREVKLLQP